MAVKPGQSTKQVKIKIRAFEMWTYRRMLKFSWKEKKATKLFWKIWKRRQN